MPTREQVLRLLEAGLDYEAVGRRLGVPAGQAYMVATGLPADGGDTLISTRLRRPGALDGATQHLANPGAKNPTGKESVHRWLKGRARGDEQMQRAARRRDAEPGGTGDEEDTDVCAVLTRDHDRITAVVKQLQAIPDRKKGGSAAQMSRRDSLVQMIAVALAGHEPVEQEFLWPEVRRVLQDGDELADEALRQEQEGTQTLNALASASPDSDEFDDLVEQLGAQLRKHVAYEDKVFAKLREAMPKKDREQLGQQLRGAQKAAPARPHPHAPQQPATAVKAAGGVAAATDRLRDAAGHRPGERRGTAEGE